MGIIYKISGPNNIPCVSKDYVGKTTKTLQGRWSDHKALYKKYMNTGNGLYLHEIMATYGIDNFTTETIEDCGKASLDEAEIYWIKELNSIKPNGYNMQSGGFISTHHQETKESISQMQKQGLSKDLPMYVSYHSANGRHGYRLQYRPTNQCMSIMVPISESLTEEMLVQIKEYLKSYTDTYNRSISDNPESLPIPIDVPEFTRKNKPLSMNLPKYINHIETKVGGIVTRHGYIVRHVPSKKNRITTCPISKPISDDMLVEAKGFLEELETNHAKKLLDDQIIGNELKKLQI